MPKRSVDPLPDTSSGVLSIGLQVRIGINVRAMRMAQDLEQEDLAEKAGLLQHYISKVENGKQNLTVKTMERLAAALGVDPSVLISGPQGVSSHQSM